MVTIGPKTWELLPNNLKRLESVKLLNLELNTGYLKTELAELADHASARWALYKFISIAFSLFTYFYQEIR